MESDSRKFLVRWNNRNDSVAAAVQNLRFDEELLDVTLACGGNTIRAHKLVLAASSQYFRKVLKDHPCEHPTIVIDDLKWSELLALLHFMYYGQVLVEEEAIGSLLVAASSLAITGIGQVITALAYSQTNDAADIKPNISEVTLNGLPEKKGELDIKSIKIEPKCEFPILDRRKEAPPEETSSKENDTKVSSHKIETDESLDRKPERHEPAPKKQRLLNSPHPEESECSQRVEQHVDPNMKENIGDLLNRIPDPSHSPLPEDLSLNKNRKKILQEVLQRQFIPIEKNLGNIINGDRHSYKNSEEFNNISEDNSRDDMDSDETGPSPLPLNHPAVMAAANGTSPSSDAVPSPAGVVNYSALLDPRAPTSNGDDSQSTSSDSRFFNHMALGNNSSAYVPVLGTPSLPLWMPLPTSANASPSPSPPPSLLGHQQQYLHPSTISAQEMQATLEQYQRKLAFHEPRPCPTCKRMYRDAATLRTHMSIMHTEGNEPFYCSCGSLFRTKYDMYQHKKNGHRS